MIDSDGANSASDWFDLEDCEQKNKIVNPIHKGRTHTYKQTIVPE